MSNKIQKEDNRIFNKLREFCKNKAWNQNESAMLMDVVGKNDYEEIKQFLLNGHSKKFGIRVVGVAGVFKSHKLLISDKGVLDELCSVE